jgi:hypothetical protein
MGHDCSRRLSPWQMRDDGLARLRVADAVRQLATLLS